MQTQQWTPNQHNKSRKLLVGESDPWAGLPKGTRV